MPLAGEVLVQLPADSDRAGADAQHARADRRGERVGVGRVRDPADAAVGRADEQRADGRLDEVVGGVEQPLAPPRSRGSAGRAQSGFCRMCPPQSADARRGGLAGGLGARAERGADLVVVEVVAVAEHDRRPLGPRQRVRVGGELRVGGPAVEHGRLRRLARDGLAPAVLVQRHPRRDREHPGAQVLAVPQRRVGAERAQERLLPGVLGRLAPEHPGQIAEHLARVGLVEPLERGDRHRLHHRL